MNPLDHLKAGLSAEADFIVTREMTIGHFVAGVFFRIEARNDERRIGDGNPPPQHRQLPRIRAALRREGRGLGLNLVKSRSGDQP
jgi:hypothetical protein